MWPSAQLVLFLMKPDLWDTGIEDHLLSCVKQGLLWINRLEIGTA